MKDSFDPNLLSELVDSAKRDTIRYLFHVQIAEPNTPTRPQAVPSGGPAQQKAPVKSNAGRNDPCPCGSGKKYKRCHGAA